MPEAYVRSESVVARRIGGETLVVPVCGGVGDLASIFSLNETGSVIWEELKVPQPQQNLVRALTRDFDIAPERAAADVEQYVAELESAGLVHKARVERSRDEQALSER